MPTAHNMKRIIFLIGLSILVAACSPEAVIELHSADLLQFGDSYSTQEITFYASQAWTAVSDVPWIKLSPSSGEAGENVLSVTVTWNEPEFGPRNGVVKISSEGVQKQVSVSQAQKDAIEFSRLQRKVLPYGDTLTVEVDHNIPIESVTVSEDATSWILPIVTKGMSHSQLLFEITCNEGLEGREGKILISGGGKEYEIPVVQPVFNLPFSNAGKGFLNYLARNFDLNGDHAISLGEALLVTEMLDVDDALSFTLENIEYFRNVTKITCGGGCRLMSSLDLSALHQLHTFVGTADVLNISGCPELEVLIMGGTGRTLDLSHNPKLRILDVGFSDSLRLDLSHNRAIESLTWCNIANEVLDMSGYPELREVCGYESKVKVLVHDCPKLERFHLSGGRALERLDLRGCPSLRTLECSEANLSELILGEMPQLEYVDLFFNSIPELDLSGSKHLKYLNCGGNALTRLSLRDCQALTRLVCYDQFATLSAIDLAGCVALDTLECSGNKLTALDLSSCAALSYLDCSGNLLTALDVTHNPALYYLWCGLNKITELDLSNNPLLYDLNCGNNLLRTLDLTHNLCLGRINCAGCPDLTAVYLSCIPSEHILSFDGPTVIYINGEIYP